MTDLEVKGWQVYPSQFTQAEAENISKELLAVMETRKRIDTTDFPPNMTPEHKAYLQGNPILEPSLPFRKFLQQNDNGTAHHLIAEPSAMFAHQFIKDMHLDAEMREFFKGNYILNSFGAVVNKKAQSAYVQNIHRDVRSWTAEPILINMLVALDDFTLENGATYLWTGTHKSDAKPADKSTADRLLIKAGDICLFDSRLWHATGSNETDNLRSCLTLNFSKPWVKPQFDYPRSLGYSMGELLKPKERQVLGYDSRVPESLNEYYRPREQRMYKEIE